MYSILVVLATLAVALPLATAQFNCNTISCGVGGLIPLADDIVPPGWRVRESVPYGICNGYPVIGTTTTVCVDDVKPSLDCDGPDAVIVTRRGNPNARATIHMSYTCAAHGESQKIKLNQNDKPKSENLS